MDLFMKIFASLWLAIGGYGIYWNVKEDIKTMKELKEEDLI